MFGKKLLNFSGVLLLLLGAFMLLPAAGIPGLGMQAAVAQSDPCAPANLARSIGRTAATLGGDQQAMVSWCRSQEQVESAAARSSGATVSKGPTQLKAEPKTAEIWCGKNNCVCWKGKLHNGCNNLAACATKLNCVGTVCGCTTK